MRADKVEGCTVTFGQTEGSAPAPGTKIYRSYNHSLEKALENNPPTRLIPAEIRLAQTDGGRYHLTAEAAGGASASVEFTAEPALNRDKAAAGLRSSLSRRSGIFSFALTELPEDGPLPFLPSSGTGRGTGIRSRRSRYEGKHPLRPPGQDQNHTSGTADSAQLRQLIVPKHLRISRHRA